MKRNNSSTRILGIASLLIFLGCGSALAQGTTYHVFFLGGQSNMEGFGTVTELPDQENQVVDGVMIYQGSPGPDGSSDAGNGTWARLQPGHGSGFRSDGKANQYSPRFGMELSFGRHLRELYPESNFAIIKYARDGSSIDCRAAAHWGCWDPDFEEGNRLNQYDYFLKTLDGAFSQQDIDGDGQADTLIPAGILWMQGESDASYTEEIAKGYLKNLTHLMNLMRAALRADDLPVLVGRISDSGNDADGMVWNYGDIVRAAQNAFAERDPYAALIPRTDRYDYSDPWHYDTAGYLDLGRQFANAWNTIKPGH